MVTEPRRKVRDLDEHRTERLAHRLAAHRLAAHLTEHGVFSASLEDPANREERGKK